MKRMYVNPSRKGLTVLSLAGKAFEHKENGTAVPATTFNRRLVKDGDLVIVEPAKAKAKETTKSTGKAQGKTSKTGE
jgi:hypothetical protein